LSNLEHIPAKALGSVANAAQFPDRPVTSTWAAWSRRGFSTSPLPRCSRIPRLPDSKGAFPTRARGGGRSRPPSTRRCPFRSSPRGYQRFSSRGESDFQDKLLSAMRHQFGGHVEKRRG